MRWKPRPRLADGSCRPGDAASVSLQRAPYGTGSWDYKAIGQFSLPQIDDADGGQGIRDSSPEAVGYPASPALASTWNIERAKQYGVALGRDTRNKGYQQVTSPGMEICRMPYSVGTRRHQ